MKGPVRRRAVLLVWFFVMTLSGCGPLPRLSPPPRPEESDVSVLGLKDVRYWGDEVTPQTIATGLDSVRREREYWKATGHTGPLPPAYYLARSPAVVRMARSGLASW